MQLESLQKARDECERQFQEKVAEIGVLIDRAQTAEYKLDQCLRVVREYVSSELADDPSQDDPSCELYPLIELVRKRPGR